MFVHMHADSSRGADGTAASCSLWSRARPVVAPYLRGAVWWLKQALGSCLGAPSSIPDSATEVGFDR